MNYALRLLLGASFLIVGVSTPSTAWAGKDFGFTCEGLLNQRAHLAESWGQAQKAIASIRERVYGQQDAIKAQLRAAVAEDFVFFTGGPGAAKTMIARTVFKSMLNSISESEKREFILQFHKFLPESKITGTQVIQSLLEKGKYEIETSTSLVGDRYLFLIADEAEKANPATLNSLLSVLNEREALHGSKVVKAILSSGVFTSNKSAASFLSDFKEDRPSGEALLDRMGQKVYVLNQQLSVKDRLGLYNKIKGLKEARQLESYSDVLEPFPVFALIDLMDKIELPDHIIHDITYLTREVDSQVTTRVNNSRQEVYTKQRESELFPSNQFSNRSTLRDVRLLKASKIIEALWNGTAFEDVDFTVDRNDLYLLGNSFVTAGMGGVMPKQHDVSDFALKLQDASTKWPVQFLIRAGGTAWEPASMEAIYSPYEGVIRLKQNLQKRDFEFRVPVIRNKKGEITGFGEFGNEFAEYRVEPEAEKLFVQELNELDKNQNIDLERPEYQASEQFDLALQKDTIQKAHKDQIRDIQAEVNIFTNTLNIRITHEKDNSPIQPQAVAVDKKLADSFLWGQQDGALEGLLDGLTTESEQSKSFKVNTPPAKDENAQERQAYELVQQSFQSLDSRYLEMSHVIEAMMTSILMEEHTYVFGPPGGAKTKLARELLGGVIRALKRNESTELIRGVLEKANKKDGDFTKMVQDFLTELRSESQKDFDIFILQFHKFLPEGALIGFPKLQQQIDTGVEEIEYSTSMAAQKFVYAILDEADKANPQTLVSLFSILNEREIFNGTMVKAALKSAVVTSNKMPSELIESFMDDKDSAYPFQDRLMFKVFTMNKMADEKGLASLIYNFLMGNLSEDSNLMLPMEELKVLSEKVEVEQEIIPELASEIYEAHLGRQLQESEKSFADYEDSRQEFPDYYVPAQLATDRSHPKFLDFLKPRFIMHQLRQGVPYDKLRFTFTLADLHLLFEGLGYWLPTEFKVAEDNSTDAKGVYKYAADTEKIEALLSSGRLLRRNQYFLDQGLKEIRNFESVIDSVVRDYVTEHQNYVSQYKKLFPKLKLKTTKKKKAAKKKAAKKKGAKK